MGTLIIKPVSDAGKFILSGDIDAETDLSTLLESSATALFLNLAQVENIFSIGAKRWLEGIRALRKRGTEIHYEECSEIFVEFCNLSPAFVHDVHIHSFEISFMCDHCDHYELKMLEMLQHAHPLNSLEPVIQAEELVECQNTVRGIHVDIKVRQYLMQIVHLTREHDDLALGGSPRASIALFRTAQAMAAIRGRNYVQPDDVKRVAPSVMTHRLILRPESRLRKVTAEQVVHDIIDEIAVPTLE